MLAKSIRPMYEWIWLCFARARSHWGVRMNLVVVSSSSIIFVDRVYPYFCRKLSVWTLMLGSRQISFSGFRARWRQEWEINREQAGLQTICRNEWQSQNIHAQEELECTCPSFDIIASAHFLILYKEKKSGSHSNLPPVKYAQNLTRVPYRSVSKYLAVRAQRSAPTDKTLILY